jgi:hypothetical protein
MTCRCFLKPSLVGSFAVAMFLAMTGSAAGHDHPGTTLTANVPPGPALIAGGTGATWERLWTFGTGNPHTDLDYFTNGGEMYVAAGTLAIGPNSGGQSIFKLTQGGAVTPTGFQLIANHPSAFCASDPSAATGLQHDVEATPKGNVLFNTTNPFADTRDAQLLIDTTDNEGRCHDSPTGGLNTTDPQGGLEIVDITNVAAPKEIGMTSHIGEAHTVNVDPKRPHIAFAVSSDFVTLPAFNAATQAGCTADDVTCNRPDEDTDTATVQNLALDGFEVVNLKSCMDFPSLTSLDAKRLTCANGIKVYRYRWPSALISMGHSVDVIAGCHELEIYPKGPDGRELLTCAGVQSTLLFDMSGAFNDNGTPNNYLDDYPNGTPLPCRVRSSSSPGPFFSGAKVVDCVDTTEANPGSTELNIEGWKAIGAPSLTGVVHVGSVIHQGRPPNNEPPPYDSPADVQISHEAELTGSRKFILTTDERGGGVAPPGAACLTAGDNLKGNGGIHAYSVDRLLTRTPIGVDPNPLVPPAVPTPQAVAAWNSYALTPGGAKAIHRVPVRTPAEPSVCTSHVFQQIPGQNRIFMGWYSQGTQVIDFIEHPDGRFEFREAGWFIPEAANTWTSAIFKMQNNGNGTFTYWGASNDFGSRNAVDIYKVTLPAPPAVPTAVNLLTFSAKRAGSAMEVRWRTAQETALLGFNVYRSSSGGPTIRLNRTLIRAKGRGAAGARYRLVDHRRSPVGTTVFTYRLQAVETGGTRYWVATSVVKR